ncbi:MULTISPECIES: hypothetical protein [unclassified Duganella]|uniref:hypothetical protein n=1 Tax=unclassified Duganella TaxID=2636909 RepID=UPI00087F3ECC|nr:MULTISPECIES: hypothetical protein [unclassified Duganella]SDG77323.1 hypothetical protein SAMN05216320_10717 [Duganella sp. OV458]SDK04296.1 hypothetical protein SAMN05428973_10817 [Duganella sp. OV510]
MKLQFRHLGFNGRSGAASAVIPGPKPVSNLDWPAEFSIQAGFFIAPKGAALNITPDFSASIPNSQNMVHMNFIWEQEVPGSERVKHVWPASGEYRIAFAEMLAGTLEFAETELPG